MLTEFPRTARTSDRSYSCVELLIAISETGYAALVFCRVQQRLESRIIRASTPELAENSRKSDDLLALDCTYRIARTAEALALTELKRLKNAISYTQALSVPDVLAKLQMIIGSEIDAEDSSAFPLPQIASALQDLKSITRHSAVRRNRETTRSTISQYWNAAIQQISEQSL